MTIPRQVLPGCDYMITRRCSERRFFLRPDRETNEAFVYCLGLAARRAKVDVLFVISMSNHYHAGLHDPDGNFPVFAEHFHALLARCQNTHLARFEAFWSSDPTSVVRLVDPADVLAKMTYAYANPCAADLVDTAAEWPGVSSLHAALTTGEMTARRPSYFFREKGDQPESVTVRICRPHAFADLSEDEWKGLVAEHVRMAEMEHRERRRSAGKAVLGRRAILDEKPFESPTRPSSHFGINPSIAAKDRRSRSKALTGSKAFVESYRSALKSWRDGIADALFPYGTYWMRKFARAVCEAAESVREALAPPVESVSPA